MSITLTNNNLENYSQTLKTKTNKLKQGGIFVKTKSFFTIAILPIFSHKAFIIFFSIDMLAV